MSRRYRFNLACLLLIALTVPVGAAEWRSTGSAVPAAPVVRVSQLEAGRTRVELALPGLFSETVRIDGRDHARVSLPGQVQRLERGAPQLPHVTTSLTIPARGTPRVRVLATEYRDLASDPVEPSKGSIPRTVDPSSVAYTFGPAYAGGVFPAAVAELSAPYVLRDHRGVNLRLNPVQWDADRGVLRVLVRAAVEVVTSGEGGLNPLDHPPGRTPPAFAALYARQFANLDPAAKDALDPGEGRMLVVCHDPFVGAVQPFLDWKRQRGIPVELITTSSVGGTVAGIQAAISERYAQAGGLAYVVLVGDGAEVPYYVREADGANDDTRYVRLAGEDAYPDALISRISAQTPDQVATQVAKFVAYERDVAGPAAWTHRGVGIASDEDGGSDIHDFERMDELRERLLAFDFSQVDRVYQNLGGTTADIAAAVNAGRSLVDYMGHGSGQAWGSVVFQTGDVHALENTAWPWIIDVSCFNGGFSWLSECLAEAWLRAGSAAQPHGAVGVYAASGSIPWVEPTVMQHEAIRQLCNGSSLVLGTLAHAGIIEVLDQYGESGVGLLLLEHYNLFGDCSLVVRTASPEPIVVQAPTVVAEDLPSVAVSTDAPGAVVTVSSAGVIHGSVRANSQGQAEVPLTEPVAGVGTVTLTVFGANRQTHQSILPVADLTSVEIDPPTVPVGASTPVTVTVTNPDGAALADVLVGIEGFGFASDPAATDAAGEVTLTVTPSYGEVLRVRGELSGQGLDLFELELPVVGALPLDDPAVTAAVPAIGLAGALTPLREGTVTASLGSSGFTLYLRGDGLATSGVTEGDELVLPVTPVELSPVTAAIGRAGHEIFQQELAVIEALGTLAGSVVDTAQGGAALAGAVIEGRAAGSDPALPPLFTALTDSSGAFAPTDPLPVGDYELRLRCFGYDDHAETVFLAYGANTLEIGLGPAPTGQISGTVTELYGGEALPAAVSLRRADTDAVVVAVDTDPATGAYAAADLPYWDYRVVAESFGYTPESATRTLAEPAISVDFALAGAPGELLVLREGEAEELVAGLDSLGYNLTLESAANSDPSSWGIYDLVVYAAGVTGQPLSSASLRAGLLDHVRSGGRLLIEGGAVADAAANDPGHPELAAEVLHVAAWHGDNGGDVTVAEGNHPVMRVPHDLDDPIDITFYDWAVADRATATSDAVAVGGWSGFPAEASVIAHDDPDTDGGETVVLLFAYEAAGAGRRQLLENAVVWLLNAAPGPTPVVESPLPASLRLTGSRPNPFNPRTEIGFALPRAGPVELAIHDLRGRRVRTLVRGELPAGRHQAVWQGRDDAGRTLASGIYLVRLAAGGEYRVSKLTLLK